MGKVALILGILGILLGGAIFVISLLLPVITDGRTSWDEAMIGIIPGALILSFSFIIAIAGVIVILIRRKKAVTSSQ
jgi:ABC-type antimicrobial peptide transport system permease subunit